MEEQRTCNAPVGGSIPLLGLYMRAWCLMASIGAFQAFGTGSNPVARLKLDAHDGHHLEIKRVMRANQALDNLHRRMLRWVIIYWCDNKYTEANTAAQW